MYFLFNLTNSTTNWFPPSVRTNKLCVWWENIEFYLLRFLLSKFPNFQKFHDVSHISKIAGARCLKSHC